MATPKIVFRSEPLIFSKRFSFPISVVKLNIASFTFASAKRYYSEAVGLQDDFYEF